MSTTPIWFHDYVLVTLVTQALKGPTPSWIRRGNYRQAEMPFLKGSSQRLVTLTFTTKAGNFSADFSPYPDMKISRFGCEDF